MDRKQFIKTCGYTCAGAIAFGTFLPSCTSMKMIEGNIEGDNILVPIANFAVARDSEITYKEFLIVQNDQLQFPIYVSRKDDGSYTAFMMKCTHQGTELSAYGNKLHCSAHGSEFDIQGNPTSGPATKPLRRFAAYAENDFLKISLKSV